MPEPTSIPRVGGPDGITPVGSQRTYMNAIGNNKATTIDGVVYKGHALDQMQGRGILSPSVVKDALINRAFITNGNTSGTYVVTGQNGIHAVINDLGEVITVW